MKLLRWEQVNGWRLLQHCLSQRLNCQDFVKAVTQIGGIQAQVMSAAELGLWARTDGLVVQDVKSALWQDRTLVKTWAMRCTLYLLAASDFPLYVAARSTYQARNWEYYFSYYGIAPVEYEAFLAAVPHVLGSMPMTREQLATAVADEIGVPKLRTLITSAGWGSPLKPSALKGDLCFGPSQGQNVTFVNPRKWIKNWESVEPYAALQEVARRYLRAYGPATPENFAIWWGLQTVPARKLFQSLESELEEVDVEGWHAVALRTTLEAMQNLTVSDEVRLLPLFDGYTFGCGRDSEVHLSRTYKNLVFRPQGWISAVVLVNGGVSGVWEYRMQRGQMAVKVRMFSAPASALKWSIEEEAERLGGFLETRVVVEFEDL